MSLAALVPGLGLAQDPALRALEDRITALEDKLEARDELIKQQQEQLARVGAAPDVAQGGDGSLDSFLRSVQIGGHVAGSYTYNFNNPVVNGVNTAPNGGASFTPNTLCQFNCNHNEFSLDAAKLEIGRSASEAGRLGFQFDLLYGQNANIFGGLAGALATEGDSNPGAFSSDQELFVQQAFASYNFNGVEFRLGKFETPLGYELIDSDANANVTQGLLFTFAIPLFHTGAFASGAVGEELTWGAGIVNGFNSTREAGDGKAFVGRLGWKRGPLLAAVATYIGSLGETRVNSDGFEVGDDQLTKIFDGILEYSGASWKTWVNVDVGRTEVRNAQNAQFFGASVGYKQDLSDKLYLALRGEYMNDDGGTRFGPVGVANGVLPSGTPANIDATTATATLGYRIAGNLLARVEYRRDFVDCDRPRCNFFFESSTPSLAGGGSEDTNDLAVIELVYSFD
jgi:hypothetical protein